MRLPELHRGRLERRYKRFLADITLDSGEAVVAHCPNPGSMKGCAPSRAQVWVSRSDNPKRKLAYTWELVLIEGSTVCVNTLRANDLVAEAIARGSIAELADYSDIRREVRVSEKSRIDFELRRELEQCYVEVKSVTMGVGGGVSEFPDSVTKRGAKHLEELIELGKQGHRAVLFFLAFRDDTQCVRPAESIDPHYAKTLRQAVEAGVEVLAYGTHFEGRNVAVTSRIEVDLQ